VNIQPCSPLGELAEASVVLRGILAQLGLDPAACGTSLPLSEACRRRNLEPRTTVRVLQAAATAGGAPPQLMTLEELCDLAETRHTAIREELESLSKHAREAQAISGAFDVQIEDFIRQVDRHLEEEARLIFPFIRQGGDAGEQAPLRLAHLVEIEKQHHDLDERLSILEGAVEEAGDIPRPEAERLQGALGRVRSFLHDQIFHENQLFFPRIRSRLAFAQDGERAGAGAGHG